MDTYPGFTKRGNCFWFRVSQNGKQIWVNGGDSIQAAREKKAVLVGKSKTGDLPSFKKVLFEEAAQDYLTYISINNSNQQRPQASVKALSSFFNGMLIQKIDFSVVERYKKTRLEQGKSHATINNEVSCLGVILKLAVKAKKATTVPIIERLPAPPPREDIFSHEQYLELLKILPDYMVPFVKWAFLTGMRKTEMQTLEWSDVDWENKKIIIPASKTKTKTQREIPLTDSMLLILTEQFGKRNLEHPDCPWVFFQPNGSRLKDYSSCWTTARKKLGLEHHRLHGMRRTMLTNGIESGVVGSRIIPASFPGLF